MRILGVAIISGANPAAGAEITFTVPAGKLWKIRSVKATLVTDGTAANREPSLVVTDAAGVTSVALIPSGTNHTASQTRIYSWISQAGFRGAGATALHMVVSIGELWAVGGAVISTSTANLQAADDWGTPQLVVEEWG